MEIIFFELNAIQKERFKKALPDDDLVFRPEPLTETNIPSCCTAQIVSIFVHSKITEKILTQFPKLQLIITRSTGFDHIDLQATKRRNIQVCFAPMFATESVAEHTFALLLMLSKKIKQSCCSLAMFSATSQSIEGFELFGKTLGIIGLGNIGKKVAYIAQSFGMKIIVHDDCQKKDPTNLYTFVDLLTLYNQADIITFHVPYTAETYHLLNQKTLPHLKKGVVILNTARGEIIETEALLEGIESGIIAQAGLDVLEEELFTQNPLQYGKENKLCDEKYKLVLQNYALINHPNVIVTCHNAYNTAEAMQRVMDQTIEIINTYKKGKNICSTP